MKKNSHRDEWLPIDSDKCAHCLCILPRMARQVNGQVEFELLYAVPMRQCGQVEGLVDCLGCWRERHANG